jgi:dihydropyrimidine dehydrogenase (NAD+) subunit PreT
MAEQAPKLSSEEYQKNFSDIYPLMTDAEAMAESSRCLFCYDAPCINACPTHIDIPKFIKQINTKNVKGSAKTILSANLFGASCARVCPVEALCEGDCVMNDLHKKPIEIGRLQRYATDHLMGRGEHTKLFERGAANGKKVAVVGAGPAGLSCAGHLAQLGYQVTVYDARPKPGGLNTYAIAEYKMTMETALKEAEIVQGLGVTIKQGVQVGKDVTVEQLEKENDAVFLGVGLGKTTPLGIEGEALPGVIDALSFIEQVKTRNFDRVEVGRRVVVIGAGNTAVDATTQAKRLGAEKVMMVYRRGADEMPAYDYEFSLAKQDGIEFLWFTAPKRVVGNGRVEKLECVKTKAKERGTPPEVVPGSEFFVECDMVIKALGQAKQTDLLGAFKVKLDPKGRVVVDPATNQTSQPKIFAGGDCVNGGKEVVNAVADGKRAAAGIHKMLFGRVPAFAGMGVPGPIKYKE